LLNCIYKPGTVVMPLHPMLLWSIMFVISRSRLTSLSAAFFHFAGTLNRFQ